MSLNKIKCPNCQHWNISNGEHDQQCSNCDAILDSRYATRIKNSVNEGYSFIDSLPPYARYIFLAIVSLVGLIVVIAFA
ncbi:hypothetical protein GO816_05620 [Mucilaginibacter sp. HME9299]|uniref:Uncharacterized protein n=1 Tax=Mucilaginibacter aquatilis TaxID=1517760 RepID=A0A6I4IAW4_9SPHI|nr:hypothetical protein [Mucilaginibacter aquatilis]